MGTRKLHIATVALEISSSSALQADAAILSWICVLCTERSHTVRRGCPIERVQMSYTKDVGQRNEARWGTPHVCTDITRVRSSSHSVGIRQKPGIVLGGNQSNQSTANPIVMNSIGTTTCAPPISCLGIGKHCHNVIRLDPKVVMWCATSSLCHSTFDPNEELGIHMVFEIERGSR
ncbi:hypothetical protein BDV97DRAFT_219301 [Delphinella strobiligena]|nr:hypothetical protein BDV97DRAFT_219301 [Delphinella strobiligena]